MNAAARFFLNEILGHNWQSIPVQSGAVNNLWRIETSVRHFCFKQQPASVHNGVVRQDDVRLQIHLARANLSPMPRYWNQDCTLVLSDWIDCTTLAEEPDIDKQISYLATMLKRIHQQTPDLARWSMHCRVQNYLSALAYYDAQAASYHKTKIEPLQDLITQWDTAPGVFCHNDLSFPHILLPQAADEPVQVVDWEYAGYGQPLFDLASAIEINQLHDAQAEQLCAQYDKTLTLQKVAPWRHVLAAINALWFDLQRVQAEHAD